jgi:hypothetical protein
VPAGGGEGEQRHWGRRMHHSDILTDVVAHPFELAKMMDQRDPGKR